MKISVSHETLDWLLSKENSPVRYLTLTRLLEKWEGSREVRDARARLGEYEPTRKILAARANFWRKGAKLYQKYGGGYWQIIFLGEMCATREMRGVDEGVEFVLASRGKFEGDRPWFAIHCLNANVLRGMVALGYGDDARVREGLEHVASEVVATSGIPCPIAEWTVYPACRMALPKVLLAMTSLPPAERTPAMKKAARICRDQLLAQDVSRYVSPHATAFYAHLMAMPAGAPRSWSWKPERRAAIAPIKAEFLRSRGGLGALRDKAGWLRFGFPLHYNSDTLEAMLALAQADTPAASPRIRHAIATILSRRRADGRWNLDFTHNGKMICDVEKKGSPSRWITYRALTVLKHFRGIELPK